MWGLGGYFQMPLKLLWRIPRWWKGELCTSKRNAMFRLDSSLPRSMYRETNKKRRDTDWRKGQEDSTSRKARKKSRGVPLWGLENMLGETQQDISLPQIHLEGLRDWTCVCALKIPPLGQLPRSELLATLRFVVFNYLSLFLLPLRLLPTSHRNIPCQQIPCCLCVVYTEDVWGSVTLQRWDYSSAFHRGAAASVNLYAAARSSVEPMPESRSKIKPCPDSHALTEPKPLPPWT